MFDEFDPWYHMHLEMESWPCRELRNLDKSRRDTCSRQARRGEESGSNGVIACERAREQRSRRETERAIFALSRGGGHRSRERGPRSATRVAAARGVWPQIAFLTWRNRERVEKRPWRRSTRLNHEAEREKLSKRKREKESQALFVSCRVLLDSLPSSVWFSVTYDLQMILSYFKTHFCGVRFLRK